MKKTIFLRKKRLHRQRQLVLSKLTLIDDFAHFAHFGQNHVRSRPENVPRNMEAIEDTGPHRGRPEEGIPPPPDKGVSSRLGRPPSFTYRTSPSVRWGFPGG